MENLINKFIDDCVVVLTAGGEGSRFQSVPGANGIQKSAFVLPTGESMIERTINNYKSTGIKNFVILAYHNAESLEKLLGNGSALGVSISFSYDPEKPVGRGGAIKHAILSGVIAKDKNLIVHNPDDQLVGNSKDVILDAVKTHIEEVEKGAVATAIMVGGTNYEFSGFEIVDGKVVGAEMYPFISIPTHIGMTIFSPEAINYFDKLFSTTEKTDFEAVLFPVLTKESRLSAHFVPNDSWISVNDEKGLKKLIKTLTV